MRHSLGSLAIDAGAGMVAASFPLAFGSATALRRYLQELDPRQHTDLLAHLAPDDPDRPWVEATAATIDALRREHRTLALLDCRRTSGPDSECGILLHEPRRTATVRGDDAMSAGVALLRTGDALHVQPRLFRRIRSNGALLPFGAGEDEAVPAAGVEAAIRDCLSGERLRTATMAMRSAALRPVRDPLRLLARARLTTPAELVLAQWRRGGDGSVYGLVNAATALAHGEPRLARRLARERDAGRLLAACGIDAATTAVATH